VTTGTRQKVPNAVKELKERKTSMLKLVTGELEPDRGEVIRHGELCISQLEQDLTIDMNSLRP